jgi:hypothetical protein
MNRLIDRNRGQNNFLVIKAGYSSPLDMPINEILGHLNTIHVLKLYLSVITLS